MTRLIPIVLLSCLIARAEDRKPTAEETQAAARDVVDIHPDVRARARTTILAAGTAALPVLRLEMKKHNDLHELWQVAEAIELLDVTPKEIVSINSVGPFAISQYGRFVATWETADTVFVKNGMTMHRFKSKGNPGAAPPAANAPARLAPVFLREESVAVPMQSHEGMEVYDWSRGDLRGGIVLDVRREGGGAEPIRALVRLDDERVLSVHTSQVLIQRPLRKSRSLTVLKEWGALQTVSVVEGGIVGLCKADTVVVWDSTTSKWRGEAKVPFKGANLLAGASHAKVVAAGSSETAEVVLGDDRLRFDVCRPSGFEAGKLTAIAASPDGAWIAMGGADGRVLLRLATTWEVIAELKVEGSVSQVEFSEDNTTLGVQGGKTLQTYKVRGK